MTTPTTTARHGRRTWVPTADTIAAIAARVRSGATIGDAAREHGVSARTVERRAAQDPALAAALQRAYADRWEAHRLPHGTHARYVHWGCRCDACRAANAAVHRRGRRGRKARRAAARFKHGAAAYSNWGCRCETCKAAFAEGQQPGWQAETLDHARRHRYTWTGADLDTAARDDLTIKQIALMLGRTYWAVASARSRIRRDPPQPGRGTVIA